jgi:aspartate/methionine/tyrosine aminotransferase
VSGRGGIVIVDEIYQGLVYDQKSETALSISDHVIVINSFSKYFGMTGWRLGWTVVPESYLPHFEKLAQNFYLSPPTCSQYAALAAFNEKTLKELQKRRKEFQYRRDYLLPKLEEVGFKIPAIPQGAFYIYADCSALSPDSELLAGELLEKAHVAIAPGLDFGKHEAKQYVRIAYTQPQERLQQAIERIKNYLDTR